MNTLPRTSTFAVYLIAVAVAISAAIWAFFMERRITFDDYGLFNPIYMYANYGVISYPAHQQYHLMVVHPPTHYLVIGSLLRIGVPVPYAEAIPPFLLIVAGVIVITKARFSDEAKVGLLFGLIAGSLLPWVATFGNFGMGVTRPDLEVAFAWFVGLVGLESGRLDDWNPRKLCLGSFFLAYASILHYPAIVAWMGILPYLIWVMKVKGRKVASRPVLALVFGGLLIAIPYLLLWFIPYFQQIIEWVGAPGNRPFGSISASVVTHIAVYKSIYPHFTDLFSRIMFFPLGIGIPTVFFSTLVLIFRRETRGIAISSLPNLLFLLILIQRKTTNAGYFIPELMLYASAFTIFVVLFANAFFKKVARAMPRLQRSITPAISILLILLLIFGTTWIYRAEISAEPRLDEMAIARAAGRQIIGPNALVGAEIGRNYIYGETYWYMTNPYVLWNRINGLNLTRFFAKSDAIGIDNFLSSDTWNEYNESLISWYANGPLNLRGFYFSTRHNPTLTYMLVSVKQYSVIGYGLLGNWTVMRFSQSEYGNYVFVAAECSRRDYPPVGNFSINPNLRTYALFSDTYFMPLTSANNQREMVTFISETREYLSQRTDISEKCSIRDEIRLAVSYLDARDLLRSLDGDRPIQFYPDLPGAFAARFSASNGTGIFYDNFADEAVGDEPSKWIIYKGPMTYARVEGCAQNGGFNKCVRITDNSSSAYSQMSPQVEFGTVSSIEFVVLANQTTKPLNIYGTTAAWNGIGIHFALRENGMMSYYDGSNWHDFFRYDAGKWYDILMTHVGTKGYDIYVNASLAVHNAEMAMSGSIMNIEFQTYPTVQGGTWYVSWVRVTYAGRGPAVGTEPPLINQVLTYLLELAVAVVIILILAKQERKVSANHDKVRNGANHGVG